MKYSLSFEGSIPVELLEALADMVAAKIVERMGEPPIVKTRPATDEEKAAFEKFSVSLLSSSSSVQSYDPPKGDRIPVRDREPEKEAPETEPDKSSDLSLEGQEKSTGYLGDRKLRKKAGKVQESKEGRE